MKPDELRTLCEETLKQGKQKYNQMLGIISHIVDEQYEVVAVDSDTGVPHPGDVYALNAVLCQQVINSGKTVALTEVNGTPGLALHPLYDLFPCEVYISSPIYVNGQVWGTINYTSFKVRNTPFSAEEIQYNEAEAAKIAHAIEQLEPDE